LDAKVIVKGPRGSHSVTKREAAAIQLANKAASGDLKAIKEVYRLNKEIEEHKPLGPAPRFVVNFIKPGNGRPKEGVRTLTAAEVAELSANGNY
jgi:hypothetical protein